MGCGRCGELTGVLEEALVLLDGAGDAFGDIASACEYPAKSAGDLNPEDRGEALDEVLDILAAIRKKASDSDWKCDQAEERLRKEAGL